MNLSYALLALTTIICLFTRNRSLLLFSILATTASGLFQGMINLTGLFSILFFFVLCKIFFSFKNLTKLAKVLLFTVITLFVIGFTFHMIPGFSNSLVIDKIQVSELSCPFSMYLNFDKVLAALIIYTTSNLCILEKPISRKSALQALFYCLLCVSFILTPGLLSGYIEYDPKLPDILWIWVLNNLLFVCMGEEVIFRGFLQSSLKVFLKKKPYAVHLSIIISSIVFGLAHFKGGIIYVILASVCGWFYGYIYEKTNRILCSILVHFELNLVHLIIFTYPASINMFK